MATPTHKLAVIIKNPLNKEEFLLLKQTPPQKFNDPEYDSYVDSDLWDLPSTDITAQSEPQLSDAQILIKTHDLSSSDKLNLSQFDLSSALNQVCSLSLDISSRHFVCVNKRQHTRFPNIIWLVL